MILHLNEMSQDQLDYSIAYCLGYPEYYSLPILKLRFQPNGTRWQPLFDQDSILSIARDRGVYLSGNSVEGITGKIGGVWGSTYRGYPHISLLKATVSALVGDCLDVPDVLDPDWNLV